MKRNKRFSLLVCSLSLGNFLKNKFFKKKVPQKKHSIDI